MYVPPVMKKLGLGRRREKPSQQPHACEIRECGPSQQPAREYGALVDETKFVAKRVRTIKTALAPWLRLDGPKDSCRCRALTRSKHASRSSTAKYTWSGFGRASQSSPSARGSKARQDSAAAPEIVPSRREFEFLVDRGQRRNTQQRRRCLLPEESRGISERAYCYNSVSLFPPFHKKAL